jgi:tripartite-type tricarboxylate transporter receptor subunit TctC
MTAVLASVGLTIAAAHAHAQTWPTKPIRVIVASTPGSSIDIPVRVVGERLRERIGQPFVVENRPQAGGTVAVAEAARAAPDGYTYVMGFNGPFANAPHLFAKLPYDPLKDLVPVILMSGSPFALGVPTALGVDSVRDRAARLRPILDDEGLTDALARKAPGKLNYASLGNGSGSNLTAELLKTSEKVFLVHIPYAGGPAAAQSVATNETQAAFLPPAVFAPHVAAGRVKIIAVSSKERFALLPSVPTMAESGAPGFDSYGWNGLMAPTGTPREIIVRFNREINEVLKLPEVREQFAKAQVDVGGGSPEAFGALVASETKRWGPVIRWTGLKLD